MPFVIAAMPATVPLSIRVAFVATGLALWLLQYFVINRSAGPERARFLPVTRLDALIPVVPSFAFVYFSTYVLAVLPPLLVQDGPAFVQLVVAYCVITLIGSAVHVTVPSRIERLDLLESERERSFSLRVLARFQRMCRPYGNFPSIHVAFGSAAVIIAYVVFGAAVAAAVFVWAALVAVSTLVTRQHYVADVAAGAALGGLVTVAVFLLL